MTTIEAKGHTGQIIFDGQAVTIHRKGLLARGAVGKGQKHLPLEAIAAVQWKPAGAMVNGFIQFTVPGEMSTKNRHGHSTTDAAHDENSVVFTKKQMPEFEVLRDAIQSAKARRATGSVPAAGPSAADRIQQLAGLRDQGLITPYEYEAKRTELLSQL